jgi:hypothetical protein
LKLNDPAVIHRAKLQRERSLTEISRIEALKAPREEQWENIKLRLSEGKEVEYLEIAAVIQILNEYDQKIINMKYDIDYTRHMPMEKPGLKG